MYKKINKSLTKVQKKTTKLIVNYNNLSLLPTAAQMLLTISADDIVTSSTSSEFLGTRAECLDLVARISRSKEEQCLVLQEMNNVMASLQKQVDSAKEQLGEPNRESAQYVTGVQARILRHIAFLEIAKYKAASKWCDYIHVDCDMTTCFELGLLGQSKAADLDAEYDDNESDVESNDESDDESDVPC